ncbi:MAG: helix-turn-helix domain-containing protein [Hungatella sp.]|jgi:transcriptional regulator with XRE-family HTH domain|nr:helix-turn-helix domain-containing protein [Dorea sp.]MCI9636240.1 helix-turn-helix domain-containing protein [Hungatella sp.]
MNTDMIGTRIREKRNELGLTPNNVNSLVGIRTGHLSELENGKSLPSTPTLLKLSKLFNCSVDWILFGETPNSESFKTTLSAREIELLNVFTELSLSDQEELLDIANMKMQRAKRKTQKSSYSQTTDNTNISA